MPDLSIRHAPRVYIKTLGQVAASAAARDMHPPLLTQLPRQVTQDDELCSRADPSHPESTKRVCLL
jgi:hypothetical protein